MSEQAISPNDLLLFVIGRPGAGKSTFAKYLRRALISTDVLYLNDYDLVLTYREKLRPDQIRSENNGQFEIIDRSVFIEIFKELVTPLKSNVGKRPTIVEFSRPSYVETLQSVPFIEALPFTIIYLSTSFESCVVRNAIRAKEDPINRIPEATLRTHYREDDLNKLRDAYRGRVRVLHNELSG